MKTNLNLGWVWYLPEVGAPIRDAARDLQYRQDSADQALRAAMVRHSEEEAEIRREARRIEDSVARRWTGLEIAVARLAHARARVETEIGIDASDMTEDECREALKEERKRQARYVKQSGR